MDKCPDCDSTSDLFGLIGDGKCSYCHGTGETLLSRSVLLLGAESECSTCDGTGVCPTCRGTGEK